MVKRFDFFSVDSMFLLRASEETFHGCPLLRNQSGNDVTVAYGVTRDVLRLRQHLGIKSGVVVFHKGALATTSGSTFSSVLAVMRKLQIPTIREDGSNPGAIFKQLASKAQWIVSDDFSLAQLVSEKLGLIVPGKEGDFSVVTPNYLRLHFGIEPNQVPDLLALSEGKNPLMTRKQAAKFLQTYGGIDRQRGASRDVKSTAVWRKVSVNLEYLLTRQLELTICEKGCIPLKPGQPSWEWLPDRNKSGEVLTSHGFHSLVRMLKNRCQQKIPIEGGDPNFETNYRIVRSKNELREVEKLFITSEVCALDTETSGKDPCKASLFGVSMSFGKGSAFYIPTIKPRLKDIEPGEVLRRLRKLLAGETKVIGHNLKFDSLVLRRNEIEIAQPYFDTMLAAHECFGDFDFFNLGFLAKKFLGREIKRYRDILSEGETFLDVPFSELVEHACSDADITFQLYQKLLKELEKRKILSVFLNERMVLMVELGRLEHDGITVDRGVLEKRAASLKATADDLQMKIQSDLGSSIDLESMKSIHGHLLKNDGLRSEIRGRSVSLALLEEIASRNPLVTNVVKYRRVRQRLKEINEILSETIDGKVFPLFNQIKPTWVDFSSDGPKLGEALSAGAISDSIIQSAWFSTTQSLERLLRATNDAVLRADLDKNQPDTFIGGKIVREDCDHADLLLSSLTSSSDEAFCRRLLISRSEAIKVRREIEQRYQSVFRWVEGFKRDTITKGYAEDSGKRRYLDGLRSSDLTKRGRALVTGIRWLLRY